MNQIQRLQFNSFLVNTPGTRFFAGTDDGNLYKAESATGFGLALLISPELAAQYIESIEYRKLNDQLSLFISTWGRTTRTGGGVYVSFDEGESFSPMNDGLQT